MNFKKSFLSLFEQAMVRGFEFVCIKLVAEGVEEFIVIPQDSFRGKKKFYKSAYDDNMVHVMNKGVFVVDVMCGDKESVMEFISR